MGKITKAPKDRAKAVAVGGSLKATGKAIKLCARTPEGKAQRWEKYNKRREALNLPVKPYAHWSSLYDANMEKANKANNQVDAYHKKLGWGETEVTVEVEPGVFRRLDIADTDSVPKRGIEYKGGKKTPYSLEIKSEVERDAKLVKKGWNITWVFVGGYTKPLEEALLAAGIGIEKHTPGN